MILEVFSSITQIPRLNPYTKKVWVIYRYESGDAKLKTDMYFDRGESFQ